MTGVVLALLLGTASAVAYGCSTAVQHAAVYEPDGRSDAAGLLAVLRNPRWWLSMGGDGLGLLLQVAALSSGPVVFVQPLQVLALPVALPVRSLLGAPRPSARDWWSVVAVVVGLAAFLALVGDPGEARRLRTTATVAVAVLAVAAAGVITLVALALRPTVRAVVFGALGGALFAIVAVCIDETSAVIDRDGWHVLWHHRGALLLVAILLAGAGGVALTQAAFQVGGLGAAYAVNAVIDPVLSVVLGAALLGERLPLDPARLVGYLLALGVVAAGTIGLADPRAAHPPPAPREGTPS